MVIGTWKFPMQKRAAGLFSTQINRASVNNMLTSATPPTTLHARAYYNTHSSRSSSKVSSDSVESAPNPIKCCGGTNKQIMHRSALGEKHLALGRISVARQQQLFAE
jgi:hypothetical protein